MTARKVIYSQLSADKSHGVSSGVTVSAASSSVHFTPLSAADDPWLLEGFRRFLEFILNAEADYLCGSFLHSRSRLRLNYRMGHYKRNIATSIGKFSIRVPHLRYLHPRTSIVKRSKRLSATILELLARIHTSEITPAGAVALVNLVWTMSLPAELLEKLTAGLVPVLNDWRLGIHTVEAPKTRKPRKRRLLKEAAAQLANVSAACSPMTNGINGAQGSPPPGYAVY